MTVFIYLEVIVYYKFYSYTKKYLFCVIRMLKYLYKNP